MMSRWFGVQSDSAIVPASILCIRMGTRTLLSKFCDRQPAVKLYGDFVVVSHQACLKKLLVGSVIPLAGVDA